MKTISAAAVSIARKTSGNLNKANSVPQQQKPISDLETTSGGEQKDKPLKKKRKSTDIADVAASKVKSDDVESKDGSKKSSNESLSKKSKIPLPLPKTKVNEIVNVEKSKVPSVKPSPEKCKSSSKSDKNDKTSCSGQNTKKQVQMGTTAVKKPEGEKLISQSQTCSLQTDNLKPTRKTTSLQITSDRPSVSSKAGETSAYSKASEASIKCQPPSQTKLGKYDEIAECLSLIDGLSEHTSWVMSKVLELPVDDDDAIERIRKMRRAPGIGNFFGVPYIKKGVMAHLVFKGGISEENVTSFV